MSGPAERFGESTPQLRIVEPDDLGDCLHEYVGTLSETDDRVRVLALAPDLADDEAAVEAFTRVTDRWDNASANANIVPILARDTAPRPWLAVPETGATLASVGPDLSPEAVETVVTDTAEALRTLGLYNTVHGHLSPGDIRVTEASGDGAATVQVGGFGLEGAVRAAVGEHEPTPYTAPELLDDPSGATERTDVYGLGAVTYFALSGRPPVAGADLDQAVRQGPTAPPSEHDGAVPPALDDVVTRALSVDPGERHDTPYAFQRAFLGAFDADAFEPVTDEVGDGSDGQTGDGPETAESDGQTGDATADSGAQSGDADGADSGGGGLTRRALTGALGLTAVGGAAGGYLFLDGRTGTTSPATAPEPTESEPSGPPDFGGYLDNVGNYDGTVLDARGLETVTVEVGVRANGGAYGFGPPAVHVDNGATVRWKWTGDGGGHNVVSEGDGPLDSGGTVAEAGVNYEHTFREDGVFNYYCLPHESLGMKGAVVVGDDYPTASSEEPTATGPDFDGYLDNVGNYDGTVRDARGRDIVGVEVGVEANGGAYGFGPPAVHVDSGATVQWEWTGEGGGHNVVAESGAFSSGTANVEPGVHFEHTFVEDGVYLYRCEPHESLGMKGAVVVGEE